MPGSPTDFIFQTAEAVSAISLPVGAGLAAYAKWKRGAEHERQVRERATEASAERAARDARKDEQTMRDRLISEKDDRIEKLEADLAAAREEIARLHQHIVAILSGNRDRNDQN